MRRNGSSSWLFRGFLTRVDALPFVFYPLFDLAHDVRRFPARRIHCGTHAYRDRTRVLHESIARPVAPRIVRDRYDRRTRLCREPCAAHLVGACRARRTARSFGKNHDTEPVCEAFAPLLYRLLKRADPAAALDRDRGQHREPPAEKGK